MMMLGTIMMMMTFMPGLRLIKSQQQSPHKREKTQRERERNEKGKLQTEEKPRETRLARNALQKEANMVRTQTQIRAGSA